MEAERVPILGRSFSLPPPFTIRYCPITQRDVLYLPEWWLARYGYDLPTECLLGIPGHARWFVRVVHTEVGFCFQRGWSWFAYYTCFHAGDTLSFQYEGDGNFTVTKSDSPLLVSPSPVAVVSTDSSADEEPTEDVPDLTLKLSVSQPTRSKGMGPSFIIKLAKSHMRHYMCVPVDFWKKYVKKYDHKFKMILEMASVEWNLTVSIVNNRTRASGGWKDFVKGNRLVVGNVLKFELVNKGKIHFVVSTVE